MLCLDGKPVFSFRGSFTLRSQPLLSFLKTCNLVCTSYSTFLTYLVSILGESSLGPRTPSDVPIMEAFVNIFLKEFFGLPLLRKVEFGIKLVPRTVPISKALYYLSLAKLKELKK